MSSPFAIIGTAWQFYKKHPVLNQIAFWFFFLPTATVDTIIGLVETVKAQEIDVDADILSSLSVAEIAVMIPLFIVVIYLVILGQVCTLTVAKRLVSSPAGRNRTSLKAVVKSAKKFVVPLLLVSLLRGIITLFWSLLLIVPGIIYSIRTIFYDIMLIEHGKVVYGRTMLKKSVSFVKGNTWSVFWRLAVIGLVIGSITGITILAIFSGLTAIDTRLETLAIVLGDFIEAYVSVFFIVCMVSLYADLKKSNA